MTRFGPKAGLHRLGRCALRALDAGSPAASWSSTPAAPRLSECLKRARHGGIKCRRSLRQAAGSAASEIRPARPAKTATPPRRGADQSERLDPLVAGRAAH